MIVKISSKWVLASSTPRILRSVRSHWFVSVRWWLALAFAAVAAITALAVAQVSRSQAEEALRDKAQELAAGTAVSAAARISDVGAPADLRPAAAREARRRSVALFLFDSSGSLVSSPRSLNVDVSEIPNLDELLEHALRRERLVESIDEGRRITVALPLHIDGAAGLVEVAARPDLVAAVNIVRDRIVVATAWATLIGVVVGTIVSLLITARVRRIAAAASAIEQGEFDLELRPRFPDELGKLGQAVDSMRRNLRTSFERLGMERDRLRALIEQLHEGVIGVDGDLRVVVANGRASELLGTSIRDGERLPEPWPAVSLGQFAGALFQSRARRTTIRVAPTDQHVYLVTGLPAASGADAAVLVIRDVTETERRERAEREFVANAAHELRTPLSAIASAVEVLKQGAKDDPHERDRFLDAIERQTTRLGRLVRALLTLARAQTNAEALRLEPVALRPLLYEIAADAGLSPASVRVEEDARALAHPDLIRQAVENLIANALKYAGGKGLAVVGRRSGNGSSVIEVSDEGPGMRRHEAERIVDRFYRVGDRGADGFGLGLSIAREVAQVLGGQLEIETRPSAGTTIRLRLRAPVENGR
jgi:two-component system, OmpR family, sensor histidine kinase VicK